MNDQPFGFSSPSDDEDNDASQGKDPRAGKGSDSASGADSGRGAKGGNGGKDAADGAGNQSADNPFAQLFGGFFPGGGQPGATGQGGFDPSQLSGLFSQLGQMFNSMSSSATAGPGDAVNYDLARQLAVQRLGADPTLRQGQRTAVDESLRLADLWLNESTTLPSGIITTEAWIPRQWVDSSLPTWKRLVTPLAEKMNQATIQGLPEEARNLAGPLSGMLASMGAMSFGSQLGQGIGALAADVVMSSEIGIPLSSGGTAALLPAAIESLASDLELPTQQVMVYLALREAAHQRLYQHVPWLRERILASVEEYAAGLEVDFSSVQRGMEEAMQGFDPSQLSDPQAMQNLMGNVSLQPQVSSRNQQGATRLETLLALVEGWVEVVVTAAMEDRLPHTAALTEAWSRRRATGSSAEEVFASLVGLNLRPRKAREAAALWRKVAAATDTTRRDAIWSHPDFMPTASDLDNPAAFIDGLLDAADSELDDPIAALQAQLRREAEAGPGIAPEAAADGTDAAVTEDRTDQGKQDEQPSDED